MQMRVSVVEEVVEAGKPRSYRERPDLGSTVEAGTFTGARKVLRDAVKEDPRFQGLTPVAINFKNEQQLQLIVRSGHAQLTYRLRGRRASRVE